MAMTTEERRRRNRERMRAYRKTERGAAKVREWNSQESTKVSVRAYNRARYEEFREWFQRLKIERGCSRCGYSRCSAALDFHHKEPAQKAFCVGNGCGYSREALQAEIAKCELLCANCHREQHHG